MSAHSIPLLDPSDAELATRVRIALLLKQRNSFRHLQLVIDRGTVTLLGDVASYFERQVAVATVRHIHGVYQVHDQLVVTDQTSSHSISQRKEDADPVVTATPSGTVHDAAIQASLTQSPLLSSSPPSGRSFSRRPAGWAGERPAESPGSSSFSASTNATRRVPATLTGVSAILGMLLLLITSGCGPGTGGRVPVHPARGQVNFGGKPLEGALVVLHPRNPADDRVLAARATTDAQGNFTLTTYDANDGAAVGDYVVTVVHYPLVKEGESYTAGPNSLPPVLATPDTSDLKVTISEGDNQLTPFEVKR